MIEILGDVRLLFMRHLRKSLREPVWLFIGLFQPVLYLTLFMPLLKGLGNAPGLPAGAIERTFVPGLLVMVTIFTLGFAGFGLIEDKRQGTIERWLVTPASRPAILLSMIFRDCLLLIGQVMLVCVLALLLGLSAHIAGFTIGLLLILLVGVVMAAFSYAISFIVRDESGLASLTNLIYLPVLLLAGIMLPLDLAPNWLKTLASLNPFSHVVAAERLLFAGTVNDYEVWKAFVMIFALAVLTVTWAVSRLKRMSA